LVFALGEQTGRRSIWTIRLDDPSTAAEFLSTPALEHMPVFSPDGKWIAYASNESGRSEVYVRAFPDKAQVRRISEGGGTAPVWAPDTSELYFRSASGALVAVPMQRGTGTPAGIARELFNVEARFRVSGNAAAYDVEPGGRRFIMVTQEPSPEPAVQRVNIVLNWFDELKRLVPGH
jgi:eukaryotic-like serine/threonine-protein kinase